MHTDKTFWQNNIPSILKTFKKRALKTIFKAFLRDISQNYENFKNKTDANKKEERLDCNNYRPISLILNSRKYLKN